jgi:hypothetical protein
MTKAFERLYWHDGNLSDVAFSVDSKGGSNVQLQVLLYRDSEAPQRMPLRISCQGVSHFQCALDVAELKRNAFAGNISNAYLKANTLWVYFTDGVLEVRAQRFRILSA